MALPQDGQNANGLTKVTQIPAGKELMFIDPTTNEGGIITLEDLTKQILNGLASQAFALDAGQMTLPAALNYLYGNANKGVRIKNYPNPEKIEFEIAGTEGAARSFLIFGSSGDSFNYIMLGGVSYTLKSVTLTTVYGNYKATGTISDDKKTITVTFPEQMWGRAIVIYVY